VGLQTAMDSVVWDYAAAHGYIIVSKDSDFHQRSFLYGAPPKVVWSRLGNCSTSVVEELLRARRAALETLLMMWRAPFWCSSELDVASFSAPDAGSQLTDTVCRPRAPCPAQRGCARDDILDEHGTRTHPRSPPERASPARRV